jgi:hypothetical protein
MKVAIKLEGWCRHDGQSQVLAVASGEHVGHGVEASRAILHTKIIAEELVDLIVLWDRGKALIQHKLQCIMIHADKERPAPQVRTLMPDCLHQADQFVFIGGEVEVARRELLAEVGNGFTALVEDDPKPRAGRIAVHDEFLAEVG